MSLRQKTHRNNYTLFEIAIVITLIALFTTIVFVRVWRQSPSLILDSTSVSLQRLFSTALFIAQAENSVIIIEYSTNDRNFSFSNTNIKRTYLSEFSVNIPENIEIEFIVPDLSNLIYKFYPDGTASGPAFRLKAKNKIIFHSLSFLTGMLITRREDI